jgi:hypothetical protein
MQIYRSKTTVGSVMKVIQGFEENSPLFTDPLRTWTIILYEEFVSKRPEEVEFGFAQESLEIKYGQDRELYCDFVSQA